MPNFGAIYIAHNPKDGPHVYTVGKTERDVASRMAELNADTTSLGTYSACGFFVVSDIDAAEQACHMRLKLYRVQENREFFELELGRLLPLVQEAVQPFLARSIVPEIAPEKSESEAHQGIPLAERLQLQRRRLAKAAEARRSQQEQAEGDLRATIARWEEELKIKVPVVQRTFADLSFVRWEEPDVIIASQLKFTAQVTLLSTWEGERVRLKLAKLAKKEDPPRPGAVRKDLGGNFGVIEISEEADDGRIARLSMFLFGEGILGQAKIRVTAEGISYDGHTGLWKYHMAGEAYCSSPDEAVDLLSALISEYAANPVTKARQLSSYQKAGDVGPRVLEQFYRTAILEQR